jgi:tRNA U34 5-methylaminomethyl-2-thiouridine-forming methyltransferase MnmC
MKEENNPEIEIRTSEDGSSTLYRPDIDEHYHSIHGAIQESMHIFIKAGLKYHTGNSLNILEVGFGTGLNALLTLIHEEHRPIFYHSLERFPIDTATVAQINYPNLLKTPGAKDHFAQLHQAPWNQNQKITSDFTLYKDWSDLINFKALANYDLVYFDAFAPEKQPELWTPKVFSRISETMSPGGLLVTYSCKGIVKRALKAAGLEIEKIPGPPGKREILRALKPLT